MNTQLISHCILFAFCERQLNALFFAWAIEEAFIISDICNTFTGGKQHFKFSCYPYKI